MAFTPETGAGLSTANAYTTQAFVDTYHSDRGNSKWTGADSLKQSAIIRATDYIDKRFGPKFRGTRRSKDQSLEWPRLGAFDDDQFDMTNLDLVPRKLQQAVAEYALRALLLGELAPDVPPTVPAQSQVAGVENSTEVLGGVTRTLEKIGPLETETRYGNNQEVGLTGGRAAISSLIDSTNIPEYPAADLLLQELVRSSTSRMVVRG